MLDHNLLETKFSRIGARLKVSENLEGRRRFGGGGPVTLDVRDDRKGEFFVVQLGGDREAVEVLDVQPADRHLLLLVREGGEKHKFLCGHDERHWFVAAVPESAPVGTVRAAKEALKPAEVQAVQARKKAKAWGWQTMRRNPGVYVRGTIAACTARSSRRSRTLPR